MKIYIYSTDKQEVATKFINIIRNDIPNVILIDYDILKYNLVSKLFTNMIIRDNKSIIMINKIINIANNYNDLMFNYILEHIKYRATSRSKIFIKCNDTKFINKLKRYYKRNNYYTIRVSNTATRINNYYSSISYNEKVSNTSIAKLDNYKWDSKITFIDNKTLIKDTKRLMINHIGIKIIH